jgi:hypothetical protein
MSHLLGQILHIQLTNFANICMLQPQSILQLPKESLDISKTHSTLAYTTARDPSTSQPIMTLIGLGIPMTASPPLAMESSLALT